ALESETMPPTRSYGDNLRQVRRHIKLPGEFTKIASVVSPCKHCSDEARPAQSKISNTQDCDLACHGTITISDNRRVITCKGDLDIGDGQGGIGGAGDRQAVVKPLYGQRRTSGNAGTKNGRAAKDRGH